MFKDYDKYLSTSLKVYIFVLLFVFILKLVGMNYFGIDINNPTILKIDNFCAMLKLDYLYVFVVCYLTSYIIASLTLNDNSKKLKLYMLAFLPLTILIKYTGYYINGVLYVLLQMLYLYIIIVIYEKKVRKSTIINYILYNVIFLILQSISIILRNLHIMASGYSFIISFIINLDYLIMTIIFHNVIIMKGGLLCHHYQMAEVGLSLLKKINLKKSLKRLQVNLHKFRALPKQERLSISIYIVLSLLWNTLSLVIILLIAKFSPYFY